jgi:DnaJ-class molecular chaperone
MSGLGYNYPAGAEHDPRAPWNQRDDAFCDYCDGCGYVNDEDNERDCPACSGTGLEKTPAEIRAEYLEDKADTQRDEEKN